LHVSREISFPAYNLAADVTFNRSLERKCDEYKTREASESGSVQICVWLQAFFDNCLEKKKMVVNGLRGGFKSLG
jgi:hypothetical protein